MTVRRSLPALAAFAFVALAAAMPARAEGDPAAGKKAFRKCAACHTVELGKHRIGPSLARHGLALDIAALTDPGRRLLPPARRGLRGRRAQPAFRTRTGAALQRLDAVLDPLQRTLATPA